jgi:hypothetical protein
MQKAERIREEEKQRRRKAEKKKRLTLGTSGFPVLKDFDLTSAF